MQQIAQQTINAAIPTNEADLVLIIRAPPRKAKADIKYRRLYLLFLARYIAAGIPRTKTAAIFVDSPHPRIR
jgi:hypothetical protein